MSLSSSPSPLQTRLDHGIRIAAVGARAVGRMMANNPVGRYVKSEVTDWNLPKPYRDRTLQVGFHAVSLVVFSIAVTGSVFLVDRVGLSGHRGTLVVDGQHILPAHRESERISKNHYVEVDVPDQYFVTGSIDGVEGNRVQVQVTPEEFATQPETVDVVFERTRLWNRLMAQRAAGEVQVRVEKVQDTPPTSPKGP